MFFAVTYRLALSVSGRIRVRHAVQMGVVLALTAALLMITGPSLTGQSALSPSHSHVFLSVEAAASHAHDGADPAGADVISLVSLSADSTFGAVQAPSPEPEQIAQLISSAIEGLPTSSYADPVPQALEEPPRSV